jgi:anaerobic ribonucleoside-triphosphate reductase activating protein
VIDMRYASIRNLDISNGEGVGISLFVQGCQKPHCYNCFNSETWDFNGGKEWAETTQDKFLELANRPYIKRISILGGSPLAEKNLDGVLTLVNKIRLLYGNTKTIWLYTGYIWDDIWSPDTVLQTNYGLDYSEQTSTNHQKRQEIIKLCDILVDGRYVDSLKDPSLKWCGSANQRVIDVQKTLKQKTIVLYE